jgi:hypothetical protein
MVDKKYLDVFNELENMKTIVKKGKVLDIPKEEILINREYVRKFIRQSGKVLKTKIRAEADE